MEDSRLQPPVGVWTVLSSIVGDQALTPPTRHSLGKLLPYQQADRTQAPPEANHDKSWNFTLAGLSGIVFTFAKLFQTSGQIPTRY